MIFCERCGVEVQVKGLCGDCQPGLRRGPGRSAERERVHEEIRAFSALGIPVREIAAHLGVSERLVYLVAPRRTRVAA